jgi:hypothetical protein
LGERHRDHDIIHLHADRREHHHRLGRSGERRSLEVSAFTVAGGKVYFADKPLDTDQDPTHSGYIYQAALTESAPITIMARGQKGPTSIAVDDTNVYWATGDCAIMSMPLK